MRLLADLNYDPSPLVPRLSPLTGEDLDMSMCFLRSVSPIHVQYLRNMGVAATLVVSLMVGGRLWGLISCHHYSPRFLHFEMRAACELIAEVIGTRIAALESFAQSQGELSVRRLEQRMIERISREGDWRGALFDGARSLLTPLNATGAALLFEGQALATGDAPGTEDIRAIARWVEQQNFDKVFATSGLGVDEPDFAPLAGVASGLVAARISGEPGELLLWFRSERVRTVTWGGNPFKPPSLRRRPQRIVAAPFVRAVASGRRGHVRSLDGRRPHHGAPHRRERDRRHRAIPLGAHPDGAGSTRPGSATGSLVRSARRRRRCGWPDTGGQ